mmetsp:Transcript_27771/g.47223  ORF Transcript_27771/g.47223 Transcript_27771/m.47223 type:complete len:105 (+) Transcript_27771:854-1168(+)
MVRTPAGRSDEVRSRPTKAPAHAEYKSRKQSSNSAFVGIKLNVPRARDWLENGITDEIPLVEVVEGTVHTAFAGEKAGANITIAASMAPMRRFDLLPLSSFDAL